MRHWLWLVALLLADPAFAVTPNSLAVTHRGGQSFLTFTEAGCPSGTYSVWRHTAPITTLSGLGLTAIASLDQDSGRLLFDDNPTITFGTGQNLTTGFVITDGGSHLAADQGLLVWTTAVTGSFYYAVTSSCDSALSVGTNSLTSAVSETHQAVPGAVLVSTDTNYGGSGRTVKHYYAWDDYATWDTADWGYYGHGFVVLLPSTGSDPRILLVFLNSSGCGYQEPLISPGAQPTDAVVMAPRDMCFGNGGTPVTDAYTGSIIGHAKWTGHVNAASGLYQTETEDRVVRFTTLVRDNATGDAQNFHVDSNRLYLIGVNLGGNGAQIGAHYPTVFAAVRSMTGPTDDDAYAPETNNTTIHVGTSGGPTIYQYRDLQYQAAQRRFTPTIHTPSYNNPFVHPDRYPAATTTFETYHQPYAIEWQAQTGGSFLMEINYPQWTIDRFKLNEAYPAFGNAGNSNVPAASGAWNPTSTDVPGQRNGYLDWDSSLHDLGSGVGADLDDASTSFGITVKSTSGVNTVADVTIWNTQMFRPSVGASIAWQNKAGATGAGSQLGAGTLTVGALGEMTMSGLDITSAGNRVTLSSNETVRRVRFRVTQ